MQFLWTSQNLVLYTDFDLQCIDPSLAGLLLHHDGVGQSPRSLNAVSFDFKKHVCN